MATDRRVFVATDEKGEVKLGGPWALAEIKGPAVRSSGTVDGSASVIADANEDRKSLMIVNFSNDTWLFLGEDDSVTIADGFPVPPTGYFLDNIANNAWYGVTDGTVDWRALEVTTA